MNTDDSSEKQKTVTNDNSINSAEKKLQQSQGKQNTTLTFEEKKALRQSARQLLLKGCYRMSVNKYVSLIKSGLSEFTPRDQAVIFLNCGICYQFMSQDNQQNYLKALQNMKKALIADNTYQKTYYRLVQLLRDHGHYQAALNLVPPNINNPEINLLLKEVRELHAKNPDFFKHRKGQLTMQILRNVLDELQTKIDIIFESSKHNSFSLNLIKDSILNCDSQMENIYKGIGIYLQIPNTPNKQKMMQTFIKFVSKLLLKRLEKNETKTISPIIDLLVLSTLKLYRGQLNKFLADKVDFSKKQLQLLPNSKFLSNNEYVSLSQRKVFFQPQLQLIKHVRLVDINIELFGKSYTYLSNKFFSVTKNLIPAYKQTQSSKQSQSACQTLLKFLFTNNITVMQVVYHGIKDTNPATRLNYGYGPINGGYPIYLYDYVSIDELNFMKAILVEECIKVSEVYGSVVIHELWMKRLYDVEIALTGLLGILLSMVQIYSTRSCRNINSLVNSINEVSELSHLIYILHWQTQAYKKKLEDEANINKIIELSQKIQKQLKVPAITFSYSYKALLTYFQKQQDNFIVLYLVQKIVQMILFKPTKKQKSTDRTINSDNMAIPEFKQKALTICEKKLIRTHEKIIAFEDMMKLQGSLFQDYVYKEMYLIQLGMILKLDIKKDIYIDQKLVLNAVCNDMLNGIALEVSLLTLINKPARISIYIENQKELTKTIKKFLSIPIIQQIQPFKTLLNLIYMLTCDFEYDQQMYFAKQLGVGQSEVHQVRKLQKQALDQQLNQQLSKTRKGFKLYIATEWIQIFNKLCHILRTTLKMQSYCSSKLCKIIHQVAQTNSSRFYSSQVIDFMLEARNIKEQTSLTISTKETACKFFQIICKKCNAQIFQYKHLQSIVDSLLWLISNCQHELVYFESLLGLVNLSTMSVKIPIEEIQKCLYEENSYIMHAGVCVMNNILIYNEEFQQDEEKNAKIKNRISDLIYKYIEFYRDQIITFESQLPETDYSHPKKIYNSLISLATVLKLQKLEELQSWDLAIKYIKILSNNEASELAFKLAIYHKLENKLPRNWHEGIEDQLRNLLKIEPEKYGKLMSQLK